MEWCKWILDLYNHSIENNDVSLSVFIFGWMRKPFIFETTKALICQDIGMDEFIQRFFADSSAETLMKSTTQTLRSCVGSFVKVMNETYTGNREWGMKTDQLNIQFTYNQLSKLSETWKTDKLKILFDKCLLRGSTPLNKIPLDVRHL